MYSELDENQMTFFFFNTRRVGYTNFADLVQERHKIHASGLHLTLRIRAQCLKTEVFLDSDWN